MNVALQDLLGAGMVTAAAFFVLGYCLGLSQGWKDGYRERIIDEAANREVPRG